MAVFRVEHTSHYTIMSNHHLRDKTLSLKAKGLLSLMLSLPETWDYTLAGLARISLEGKDAIRAAVAELERAGYVTRARIRNKQGHLLGTEYTVREQPLSSARPTLENPASGNPTLEHPTQLKNDSNQIPNLSRKDSFPSPSSPSQVPSPVEKGREPKGRKPRREGVCQRELEGYRALLRENIGYAAFQQERPWDLARLDEMVELMAEAICSRRKTLRVAGNDFPQAVVKSRLLKLDGQHIRFVFDCLRANTTQVRNMKQYLLTVLYNAPVTMENHYAAQVNHDFCPDHAEEAPVGTGTQT